MIGWSWQDWLPHVEDEQRSGTGVFEEMRELSNTAFGVPPCGDCGELPCRCGWVRGPAKVEQIERAWTELQSVPSYIEQQARKFADEKEMQL